MFRSSLPYILITTLILFSTSCKKDQLEWSKVERMESHTTARLNKVLFTENQTGFVVGGERFLQTIILRTTDGGKSWTALDFPEAGKGLYGINTDNFGNIYTIGYEGKLLVSSDNGQNWTFRQIQPWKEYKDIGFFKNGACLIIGGVSFNRGYIGHANSNADIQYYDSLNYEFNDLEIVNGTIAYICGYGVMQKSIDGGKTWEILNVQNDNFKAMHILNQNEIWLCGYRGTIFYSNDAGASWEKYRNGNDITKKAYQLLDILFIDSKNGWAVGEKGIVLLSTDGGKNWSEYENFTTESLRAIELMPDGNLLVAGDKGSLYKLYIQ